VNQGISSIKKSIPLRRNEKISSEKNLRAIVSSDLTRRFGKTRPKSWERNTNQNIFETEKMFESSVPIKFINISKTLRKMIISVDI
jgi:hypothetical protein